VLGGGGSVEGFLYLDARGQESAVRAEADGFCESFARAYGLALANLKRQELERRQRALQSELDAAREVQQFILPARAGTVGPLDYAMEMRAGVIVAGDVFDVVPLPHGRVAVALGDVAGHGMAPALLMSAIQAHLHARLLADPDPATAVAGVNRYLATRAMEGRFASLWLGVFEPDGTLRYVDAGHGHWAIRPRAEAAFTPPNRSLVIGVDAEAPYTADTLRLNPGDRVGLFSDGLLEQRNEAGVVFGRERLLAALATEGLVPLIRAVFDAVGSHAGGMALADDATAAVIEVRAT
jgi:sigma-B regulation protein RsbU (phosphoserine phosphatase)